MIAGDGVMSALAAKEPSAEAARSVRALAFYLPQFHPIPENDLFWGPGFTEWTNVTRARPLFHGHQQPNLPGELGYYDLRVPETRHAQAELARAHGIEGFVYWHYWFAGRQLLQRPFQEVLVSGQPDFPFCLAWANQSWSGIWHGAPNRILVEQTYPGVEDYRAHFTHLLPALQDHRYVRVDGKPLLIIYRPTEVPDLRVLSDVWRTAASRAGLPGLHLVGVDVEENLADPSPWVPADFEFDASILVRMVEKHRLIPHHPLLRARSHFRRTRLGRRVDSLRTRPFEVFPYDEVAELLVPPEPPGFEAYPCVIPNWDSTPRSGPNGVVLTGSTPHAFARHVADAVRFVQHLPGERRIILIKSWNEWAEGNYLEPDARWGREYLRALATVLGVDSITIPGR
jgi:hypothetical protein